MNGPPMLTGNYGEDINRIRNYLYQLWMEEEQMRQTIQEMQDTLNEGGNANGT